MNIHFPRKISLSTILPLPYDFYVSENQVSRAEAMLIANTDNQYLVPTSGNPLRGLIQDHVVAGVWMTSQDAFFTREEYFQLLYGALRPEDEADERSRLVTLPPTIWKPTPLWTGKQIVSGLPIIMYPLNVDRPRSLPYSRI
jgi:DNA-directed RNA polymerase I subunit RPA1